MQHSQREEAQMRKTTLYRRIRSGLTILCILLLAIVLVTPGVLQLLYRADSKVALGHAKSVRMAMQVAGVEQYGRDSAFSDASREGGVVEGLYEEILLLSKAPGDFWILQMDPDGIMLSNGPGDPAENTEIIDQLKILCKSGRPIFGICLGHQLMALAQGGKTEKLKYGHRGANQPAEDLVTGRVYITSQNHGYAVVADSLPENAKMRFVNANDGTCEGVDYLDAPIFTVQFHPEACAGPQDTDFLFDRFLDSMESYKNR